jgi:hypothetical protein
MTLPGSDNDVGRAQIAKGVARLVNRREASAKRSLVKRLGDQKMPLDVRDQKRVLTNHNFPMCDVMQTARFVVQAVNRAICR